MPTNWKNIAKKTALGLLLAVILLGAYLLGSRHRSQMRCAWVEIDIGDSLQTPFVTSKKVKQYLADDYGRLIGTPMDSIDLFRIESVLNSKASILSCNAYKTSNGRLNISITQRKPVIRFQTADYGFYSDEEGYLLPLDPDFSGNLVVVDGSIPLDTADCSRGTPADPEDCRWLEDMLKMARYINGSDIWKKRIAQIICNESGELTIVPEAGKETFIFGRPEDIGQKFEKMQMYYERIVADKGECAYNIVDVRYKKQIVCKNTEQKKNK
jgi:cell division protein FtsQ